MTDPAGAGAGDIRVCILGAGNLGSRHLQGLQALPQTARIHVFDPYESSLQTARERWGQTGASHTTSFSSTMPERIDWDCAIIASPANVRARLIHDFLSTNRCGNMILEKVLFQNQDDYDDIGHLLRKHAVKAWVNCPRRIWPQYAAFAKEIRGKNPAHLEISGSNWGMACNSIHMLDYLSFIAGSTDYTIDHVQLDPVIVESKRPGFVEMTGSFAGRFSDGSTFRIASSAQGGMPYSFMIKSSTASCLSFEDHGKILFYRNGSWVEEGLILPYQSQLTGTLVTEILEHGTCGLTPYDDSAAIHKPLIGMLLTHYRQTTGKDVSSCPVT